MCGQVSADRKWVCSLVWWSEILSQFLAPSRWNKVAALYNNYVSVSQINICYPLLWAFVDFLTYAYILVSNVWCGSFSWTWTQNLSQPKCMPFSVIIDSGELFSIVTDSQYADRVVLHMETVQFIHYKIELTLLFIWLQKKYNYRR